MPQFASLIICYILISLIISFICKKIYNIIDNKQYSAKYNASFILFFLFNRVSIILSLVYVINQPQFIKYCIDHNEFCTSFILEKNIFSFESMNSIIALLIIGFIYFRYKRNFRSNDFKSGLISPLIYKEKLKNILSDKEMIKLNIHDTDEIFAYCTGFFKTQVHLSKGIINLLSYEKLDIVILHEKAHIKRLDLFYSLLFKTLSLIDINKSQTEYYLKEWRKEKEKACDDEVIKKYSPLIVAQTILDVAINTKSKQNKLALNFTESQIVERVERLINYDQKKDNDLIFPILWLSLILILFLIFNFPLIHCTIDKIVLFFLNFFI